MFRFDPTKDKEPHYQTYDVPLYYENMSGLCLLLWVYENIDPSLSFLYSCQRFHDQARCGICDMFIDGEAGQLCTLIAREAEKGEILIEPPLSIGYPIVKDLITSQFSLADRERFFVPITNARHRFRKACEKIKGR